MAIRRAAPGHLPLVVHLVEECARVHGHRFDRVRATEALQPLLQDDRFGVVYLIEAGPDVLGYAVVTWGWSVERGGRQAFLDQLYVPSPGSPAESVALEEIVADLAARGIPAVELETDPASARGFYADHGFLADRSVRMSRAL